MRLPDAIELRGERIVIGPPVALHARGDLVEIELERVGTAFDLQVANPLAGGVSPILRPDEYFRLGFKILPYGIDLILRVTRAMQVALEDMRSGKFALMGTGATLQEYLQVVGFEDWTRIETDYRAIERDPR